MGDQQPIPQQPVIPPVNPAVPNSNAAPAPASNVPAQQKPNTTSIDMEAFIKKNASSLAQNPFKTADIEEKMLDLFKSFSEKYMKTSKEKSNIERLALASNQRIEDIAPNTLENYDNAVKDLYLLLQSVSAITEKQYKEANIPVDEAWVNAIGNGYRSEEALKTATPLVYSVAASRQSRLNTQRAYESEMLKKLEGLETEKKRSFDEANDYKMKLEESNKRIKLYEDQKTNTNIGNYSGSNFSGSQKDFEKLGNKQVPSTPTNTPATTPTSSRTNLENAVKSIYGMKETPKFTPSNNMDDGMFRSSTILNPGFTPVTMSMLQNTQNQLLRPTQNTLLGKDVYEVPHNVFSYLDIRQ